MIEALAVHPRPGRNRHAASEERALLCQFHYLSTVSGGGYIGSWLSAWIARDGYDHVWPELVGRRAHPEKEPSEIAWLRSYRNYLAPRTGLLSVDTWTAISLYLRNLILNWLVILPALCFALLGVKTIAILAFWLSALRDLLPLAFAIGGVVLMVSALRFALLNRPSRDPCTIVGEPMRGRSAKRDYAWTMQDPHHNEAARTRTGAGEAQFRRRCLLPALAAALLLSLYLVMRGPKLAEWGLFKAAWVSMLVGIGIYALGWISAWPPKTWVPCRHEEIGEVTETRDRKYWLRDFAAWLAAGAVYGVMVELGVHFVAKYLPWLMIGHAFVDRTTGVFLLTFIYGIPWIVTAQLTAEIVFVDLTSWQPSDSDREWFGRSSGWFALAAITWPIICWLVLLGSELRITTVLGFEYEKFSKGIGGVLLGILSGYATKKLSELAAARSDFQLAERPNFLIRWALPIGASIFLIILLTILSGLLDLLLFGRALPYTSLMRFPLADELGFDLLWLMIGFVTVANVAFFAWRGVNIDRFSARSTYRNRLIRVFLGASNPRRAPNPFTGFDEGDNIQMQGLWSKAGSWQPFHILNVALNVVNSKRIAWQERKVESFTVTPLHCGSATGGLGYRATTEYAGGITLGTALAISGAAASPNMGYYSSPVVSFVLALVSVRLGWWLGNPGAAGEETYRQPGPANAVRPFITEMFGLTTGDSEYVSLSDGGHFDNLGLYEMIRRRCRCIVISDAACDPNFSFEDLGNAVRKIEVDLGIYIEFTNLQALKGQSKDSGNSAGPYYAIGRVGYSGAPEATPDTADGYILYVKPGYHGTESAGIVAYASANPAFPHESTEDQSLTQAQFESYRMLGFEIMDEILRDAAANIETINYAGAGTWLSAYSLCDFVKALDPDMISRAESALSTPANKTPAEAKSQ